MEKFIKINYFSTVEYASNIASWEFEKEGTVFINPTEIYKISELDYNRSNHVYIFCIYMNNGAKFWIKNTKKEYIYINNLIPEEKKEIAKNNIKVNKQPLNKKIRIHG